MQIPRLGWGSLSVSLSVLCSNHGNVMCWDHTRRATAFPNSTGKKKPSWSAAQHTSCGVLLVVDGQEPRE